MDIVLLGPPGAGKGTQAERLESLLKMPHIATGDIFRALSIEDSPLAEQVRAYMERGEYVPDDITIRVVCAQLDRPDVRDGFILDGFPRTAKQAEALDGALAARGRQVDAAVLITAPVELLVQRISGRLQCPNCGAVYNTLTNPPAREMVCDVCGYPLIRRKDEAPEVVRARIAAYNEQTRPVIEYYRAQGKLREVDGALTIDEVNRQVDAVVLRPHAAAEPGG